MTYLSCALSLEVIPPRSGPPHEKGDIAEELFFVENSSVTYDVDSLVISQVEQTSTASSTKSTLLNNNFYSATTQPETVFTNSAVETDSI